ncbi:amphi-Trp domain-containing protein [Desulfonatronovibrio hydrogenovorans]|uniref:amphi-Trp domain-containing protein n=1 Tax=Desulfonatronovibrio hydrogenovorans TaxID=53245 RepID=UPI00068E56E2|nr:amphi-Trp domain-containing protein [Desulfonatronovibrio hydrogenovorans]
MPREKKISLESLQDSESICKYLDALKDGFRNGTINFSHQDNKLTLHPHGLIKFEIKAKHKQGEVKLHLRFRWEEDNDQNFDINPLADDAAPAQDK